MPERSQELLSIACAHPRRLAGTDAERRTAKALEGALEQAGMRPTTEPFWSHPRWPATHMLHCLMGAVGSLVAIAVPVLGFALVLVAATSFYLDVSSRWYLLRRLSFRRASQNVVALPDPDPDGDLIVLACDYDAPRTGAAFGGAATRLFAAINRLLPFVTPSGTVFWSLALLVPVLGARMAGVDADWLSILQLPQTLLLLVAAFLFGEIALSEPSPGANVNGSGVAATLRAVELLRHDDATANLGVVLTGAGDCDQQGMRSFVRSTLRGRPEAQTIVISTGAAGTGTPHYALKTAGPLTTPADLELLALAEALGEDGSFSPVRTTPGGPATVAGRYGHPSIHLNSREAGEYLPPRQRRPIDTEAAVDGGAIEQMASSLADLVRLLDRRLTRERDDTSPES